MTTQHHEKQQRATTFSQGSDARQWRADPPFVTHHFKTRNASRFSYPTHVRHATPPNNLAFEKPRPFPTPSNGQSYHACRKAYKRLTISTANYFRSRRAFHGGAISPKRSFAGVIAPRYAHERYENTDTSAELLSIAPQCEGSEGCKAPTRAITRIGTVTHGNAAGLPLPRGYKPVRLKPAAPCCQGADPC